MWGKARRERLKVVNPVSWWLRDLLRGRSTWNFSNYIMIHCNSTVLSSQATFQAGRWRFGKTNILACFPFFSSSFNAPTMLNLSFIKQNTPNKILVSLQALSAKTDAFCSASFQVTFKQTQMLCLFFSLSKIWRGQCWATFSVLHLN